MLKNLFVFLFSFSTTICHACECLWQGPFSRTSLKADLVVAGEVLPAKGNAFDFKVERVLRGETYLETLRVWARYKELCRPDIKTFPQGSRWLFALERIDQQPNNGFDPNTPNQSFGRVGDYSVSACGVHWLNLGEGVVSGSLVKGRRWVYEDEEMNPVRIELIDAYLNNGLPIEALIEAAKPQTEAKRLMEETLRYMERENNALELELSE